MQEPRVTVDEPPVEDEFGEAVREVHRLFPTGVTVVTTAVDGHPYGLAVNAFSSVSLTPPMVLVCVAETSRTHPHLISSGHLAVNILSHRQQATAARFARSGGEKFEGLDWFPGPHGSPILAGISVYVEIEVERRIPAYTHTIFIGRVVTSRSFGVPPLVYLGGGFFDGSALREAGC